MVLRGGVPRFERRTPQRPGGKARCGWLGGSIPLRGIGKGQSASTDRRWLDLCAAAAGLRAALSEADALDAAVRTLGAAYPQSKYPGDRLLRGLPT